MRTDNWASIEEAVKDLRRFNQPTTQEWRRAEAELNTSLPADFKVLVTASGSGYFGEAFLLNPLSPHPAFSLSASQMVQFRSNLGWRIPPGKLVLYPDTGGCVELGHLCTDVVILFNPVGEQNESVVLWDIEANELCCIGLPFAEWFLRLYRRDISVKRAELRDLIWEPDEPFFTPHDYGTT